MPIDKISGQDWADISKVSAISSTSIANVSGITAPSAGIVTADLISHWDFNDPNCWSSGTSFTDLANSNTGSLNGGLAVTTGSINYINTDGVNDYAQCDLPNTYGQQQTFEQWIQFSGQQFSMVRGYQTNCSSTNAGYWPNITSAGAIRYTIGGVANYTLTGSNNVTTNTWYCLTWVLDGNNMKLYKNGSQIASASISTTRTPVCANDCKLVVGIIVDGDGSITSRARSQVLGETRIYDNNLTAAQVLSNYNARSARYGL
tara:strand:- start:552 stop:1331 length:780 start_codon:yes stop_codon:yes gene_type:complete